MRIPHLAVPFRLARDGSVATVDQDSDIELLQTVGVLIDTRPGDRQVVPDYGVDDLTFVPATDVDGEWVADAAAEWEPRATLAVTRTAVEQAGRTAVTVEVDR